VLQLAIVHWPAVHEEAALAAAQACPHAPQLLTLVLRFVSQPFAAFLSQSPKPAVQMPTWQMPAEHAGVALATEQTLPQAPQLLTSLLVSATSSEPALVVWPLETATVALLALPLCDSATTEYVPVAT
jgi:hypothetical protein